MQGGAVGRVGVPQETTIPSAQPTFYGNITIADGSAPARICRGAAARRARRPDRTGRVFDRITTIDGVPDGYRAMNERESIKG
ncbi:MAG TPA: hypothetical protein VGX46_11100 [Vicinamibacterales bacterium]|nr:hypothetical protein [Vicinamibacterales bacterium]